MQTGGVQGSGVIQRAGGMTHRAPGRWVGGVFPLLVMALLGGGLLLLLNTGWYMYYFYAVLSAGVYLLSHCLGKEIYIFFFLLRILVASPLTALFFNISSEDLDGLNPLKVNIWCLCWLIIFCLELAEWLLREPAVLDGIVALALAVVACFGGVTLLRRGTSGMGLLLESYAAPITLFLFFYLRKDISFARMRRYMQVFLALILLSAAGAVLEYMAGGTLLESYYLGHGQQQQPGDSYRAMGLVGHIMLPSLMLAGCMLTHRLLDKLWQRLLLYGALIGTASLSKTRIMLVLIVAYVVGAELLRVVRQTRRFGSLRTLALRVGLVILAGAGGVLALLATPAGKSILLRMGADSGSANARLLQLQYFFQNLFQVPLYGLGGFNDNVTLINEYGQASIPEIPWINLYFEVSPLLLLLLIWFLVRVVRSGDMPFELSILLASFTPYTSFSTKSASFSVFFLFAACGVVSKRHTAAARKGRFVFPDTAPLAVIRAPQATCMAVLSLLFAALCFCFGWVFVDKQYEAHTELYVWATTPALDDMQLVREDLESTVRINKAVTDDLVRLGTTPLVMEHAAARCEAAGLTLEEDWRENLVLENQDNGRVIEIYYRDTDPKRAAELVNALADTLAAQSQTLNGSPAVQVLTHTAPPPARAYQQPRLAAVAVAGGLLALTAQVSGVLLAWYAPAFAHFFSWRMRRAF